jgi:hypothetical protein
MTKWIFQQRRFSGRTKKTAVSRTNVSKAEQAKLGGDLATKFYPAFVHFPFRADTFG